MAAIDEVIKKINETIEDAHKIFADQRQTMRIHQQLESGPIAFSKATKLTDRCISCGVAIVNYSILGRWIENEEEGHTVVKWACRECSRQFDFHGPRTKVVNALLQLSYKDA